MAKGGISLIAITSIPADALDKSGLTNTVGSNLPHNLLGSFGSGIDYTGKDDLYMACDDRGPGDGASAFRPRYQTFKLSIDPTIKDPAQAAKVELISTTLLVDEQGKPIWGYTGGYAMPPKDQRLGVRFDPESIRVSKAGSLFIADEYGPWVDEFSRDGKRQNRFEVPAKFLTDHPDGDPNMEMPPHATKGRQPNRGFEGLAITPDGSILLACLQSPLIQDNALTNPPENDRIGLNIRMLEINTKTKTTRELAYPLKSHKQGVNEVLAIDSHRFLVLERDGKPGVEAKHKSIYLIDTTEATDVSAIASLPEKKLPGEIKPVKKTLFLDLLDTKFGLSGATMPEKIEGLTFGPTLPDGRRTLVITTDNDFKPDQPSWFWVFAFEPKDLE